MAIEQLSSNSSGNDSDDKGGLSKEDLVDELNKDDDKPLKEEDKEEEVEEEEDNDDKDDEDSEDKDDDEIKLVEEEDEDKNLDDVQLVAPFRKAEIEKDFPGIFKKYPYLEKSYYTERAYREVFASPEDAKEAAETIEEVQQLEQSLLEGTTTTLISKIKEHDEDAYARLVDNYLPSLQKADPAAHNHVVGGIVKNLVTLLVREAKSTDNDELRKVALAVNKFVFNSDEFEPHKQLAPANKDTRIEDERREFIQERFEVVQEELQTKVDDILTSTIKQNIDPKNLLTDYVKKNAVRDAMEDLRGVLERDTSFRRHLDRLWEKAYASNFNRESTKAIRDAYLSKAKSALKPVITKAKNEALKGIGKRVRDDGDSDTDKSERRPYHKGERRGSTTSDKGGQKKADIPKGMTTLDFLNKD